MTMILITHHIIHIREKIWMTSTFRGLALVCYLNNEENLSLEACEEDTVNDYRKLSNVIISVKKLDKQDVKCLAYQAGGKWGDTWWINTSSDIFYQISDPDSPVIIREYFADNGLVNYGYS